MKKALLYILYIVFITLLIDFIAAQFFLNDQRAVNKIFRISHPYYHHDLKPNVKAKYMWGSRESALITNSLGFKDGTKRKIKIQGNTPRILLLGDSFTEGIGVDYENTFAGILSDQLKGKYEILNAGVVSYSPKLFYLKSKYLIEEIQLDFDKLYVFIDLSDIFDELSYASFESEERDRTFSEKIKSSALGFGLNNSIIVNRIYNRFIGYNDRMWLELEEGSELKGIAYIDVWTFDRKLLRLGREGIKSSKKYMSLINNLCETNDIDLSIVVFPRPTQILNDSIDNPHVKMWQQFTDQKNLEFINLFPAFYDDPKEEVIEKYFIPKDVHWNEQGHQYVADILFPYVDE